jgi:hypothetical protein
MISARLCFPDVYFSWGVIPDEILLTVYKKWEKGSRDRLVRIAQDKKTALLDGF